MSFFSLLAALNCNTPAKLLAYLEDAAEDNIAKLMVATGPARHVFGRMSFTQKLQATQAMKDIVQNKDAMLFALNPKPCLCSCCLQ